MASQWSSCATEQHNDADRVDITAYGCTETSSCISQSGVRNYGAPLVATGTLLANISIRFVDEALRDVLQGEPGEICVSAPTVMM